MIEVRNTKDRLLLEAEILVLSDKFNQKFLFNYTHNNIDIFMIIEFSDTANFSNLQLNKSLSLVFLTSIIYSPHI